MSRVETQARRAVDLVQADPGKAYGLAESVLARKESTPEARATALWAMGLVARERDQLDQARDTLERAIATARQGSALSLTARIESSLSLVLAYLGDLKSALAATERAAVVLKGADAARNQMQRGLLLQRTGDFEAATDIYRTALAGLRRAGDQIAEVRLLLNRSVIHTYRGDLGKAVNDLQRAMNLAQANGQTLQVAACAHNLGWVQGRRGDFPAALELFDLAERSYLALDSGAGRPSVLSIDRAETLAAAGLLDDAWSSMQAALSSLESGDNAMDLAEARLLAAQLALARGDKSAARSLAAEADGEFNKQGRTNWSLRAQTISMRSGHLEVDRASSLVMELERMGWDAEAHQARLEAGQAALALGEKRLGRHLLSGIAQRRSGSALMRAQSRHAAALLAIDEENAGGAISALRQGLRVLVEHRATMGSAELRARAATSSSQMSELAVQLALGTGRAWQVLTAVESWRAVAMHLPMVRRPRDRSLATELDALRALDAELLNAEREARGTEALNERRAALERSIRQRSLRIRGHGRATPFRLDRKEVTDRLGERALIVYLVHDGSYHALTLAGRRLRLTQLAPVGLLEDLLFGALFSLHRLSLGRGSEASLAAALESLEEAGSQLSAHLVEPLEIGERPVVIVPTQTLHRLPWLALRALRGRPAVVAPSIATWMQGSSRLRRITSESQAVLVAGPGLVAAVGEVRGLASTYRRHELFTGRKATAPAVLAALAKADLAHVACHGTFRTDNPFFSSLRLDDGPLTIYDLEQLRKVPQLMVLPACDVGVSSVLAGDELLGVAAALLHLGSGSLVAPVTPVPDHATRKLMMRFHKALVAGSGPAQAMATAAAVASDDPATIATNSAFLVLGSG